MKLVYSGNLGRTYDLATIVKAVEDNPDFELHVAGYGEFSSSCERVHFHGFLSDGNLRKLLSECDVGVVPMDESSWVGIPNKFIDYAAAGLWIVSALGGESLGLLRYYDCGTKYRSGDAKSLAEAVRRRNVAALGRSRKMWAGEFDAKKLYANYVKTVIGRLHL